MQITKIGGFLLLDILAMLFGAQGAAYCIYELLFLIHHGGYQFIIYLFVIDDLLLSYRAATRIEQLTKCCMNHCRSRGCGWVPVKPG